MFKRKRLCLWYMFMWGNILLLGTLKIKTKPFQIHFKFNKGFGKQDFDTIERPRLIRLNISKVPRWRSREFRFTAWLRHGVVSQIPRKCQLFDVNTTESIRYDNANLTSIDMIAHTIPSTCEGQDNHNFGNRLHRLHRLMRMGRVYRRLVLINGGLLEARKML